MKGWRLSIVLARVEQLPAYILVTFGKSVTQTLVIAAIAGSVASLFLNAAAIAHPAALRSEKFEITLNASDTAIVKPNHNMVLRDGVIPPDPRLGPALQLTYEPLGVRSQFNLFSIWVAEGPISIGIQYTDGSIGVFNDVARGFWTLDGADGINRVTLECPSSLNCSSTEDVREAIHVVSLGIESLPPVVKASCKIDLDCLFVGMPFAGKAECEASKGFKNQCIRQPDQRKVICREFDKDGKLVGESEVSCKLSP